MDPFARPRDVPPHPPSITFAPPNQPANQPHPDVSRYPPDPQSDLDKPDPGIAFMKGPKRKRLAKVRLHPHLSPSTPLTFQRHVMPATKVNAVVTERVGYSSPSIPCLFHTYLLFPSTL